MFPLVPVSAVVPWSPAMIAVAGPGIPHLQGWRPGPGSRQDSVAPGQAVLRESLY